MSKRSTRRSKRRGRGSASPFAQQIAAETNLKFGPEQSALVDLVGQAQQTATRRRSSVEAGYRGLVSGLDQTQNLAGKAAAAFQQTSGNIANTARANTAGLDKSADPYRAIIESEIAGSNQRGAENAQRLNTELGSERTSASRYQASQEGQIGQDLQDNLREIGQRLRDLSGQQGEYAAARLGELTGDRRQRSFELRKIRTEQSGELAKELKLADVNNTADAALETQKEGAAAATAGATVNSHGYTDAQWARFSPKHRRAIIKADGGSGKGGGKGGDTKPTHGLGSRTANEEAGARTRIDKAFGSAAHLWGNGKGNTIPATKKGAPDLVIPGGKPGRQRIRSILLQNGYSHEEVNAALDLAVWGHLSPETTRQLHAQGLHVPAEWRRTKRNRQGINRPLRKPPYRGG